jgi:hypothetical protein
LRGDGEALHPPREAGAVLGLDDEVDVVAQHREVDETQAEAFAGRQERLLERAKAAAQIEDPMRAESVGPGERA